MRVGGRSIGGNLPRNRARDSVPSFSHALPRRGDGRCTARNGTRKKINWARVGGTSRKKGVEPRAAHWHSPGKGNAKTRRGRRHPLSRAAQTHRQTNWDNDDNDNAG